MPDCIDQTKTFRLIEERIAKTSNPRHLAMLERLLEHAIGEAGPDLDRVMATLNANPRYIAWGAPPDLSPVGRDQVEYFYREKIVKGGTFFFEMDMDRIVVDDDTIVTEGYFRSLYYGADAQAMGMTVDDPAAYYVFSIRMLIVWPYDEDGYITGEESYSAFTSPTPLAKVDFEDVPQRFRDFIADRDRG